MTAANLLSYAAQIATLVLACAALPRALGVRSPALQYAFWRVLLGLCLILPFVEPMRYDEMVFAPAPVSAGAHVEATAAASLASAAPGRPLNEMIAIAAGMLLLLGASARLAWLSVGVFRLRRLRNRASERTEGFDDLRRAIGVSPDVHWSVDVRHPVAFGVLRPIVLLPIALKSADRAAQRAVVAHELHHVRRHDWAWVLGEEIVRSVFWFHPAMWWLVSRVQLARETVVDELSIKTTNARRAYLDTLLAFADDGGLAASPAFSARRHLFHRVMLLSKEGRMSPLRIAAGSAVLVAVLGFGSLGVVYAFPLRGRPVGARIPTPEGRVRSAKPISIDVTNADLQSVLRIFGRFANLNVVFDPGLRGTVTFSATDMPWDEALEKILAPHGLTFSVTETTLTVSGQPQAPSTPATRPTPGQLPPPPPPPPSRDLARSPDQYMPPPPPPAPSATQATEPPMSAEFKAVLERLKPVRLGKDVAPPPALKKSVKAEYPDEARAAHIEGDVTLETIIDADGKVAAVRVIRSVPGLDEAAIDAAKRWEFTPARLNGTPTPVLVTMVMTFSLK